MFHHYNVHANARTASHTNTHTHTRPHTLATTPLQTTCKRANASACVPPSPPQPNTHPHAQVHAMARSHTYQTLCSKHAVLYKGQLDLCKGVLWVGCCSVPTDQESCHRVVAVTLGSPFSGKLTCTLLSSCPSVSAGS